MSFGRQVLGWNRKVYRKRDQVFQEAFIQLMDEMQAKCPKDTNFLMSSLEVAKDRTPRMANKRPRGAAPGSFTWDRGTWVGVVESAKFGERLYLGYTAEYAKYVHDGHGGVPPRPWVMLVSQRWRAIVQETARRIAASA